MTATLKISGMSCMNCVKHVKHALADVSGVTEFNVEIGMAVLTGEFDLEAAKAAVEEAGYQVVSVA